jgi:hypothetical protein
MNKKSSRSHAILQILVEQKWIETEKTDPSTIPMKKVNLNDYYFIQFFISDEINEKSLS